MANRTRTLEDLGVSLSFWQGKSVFLTGHTGFKGGWLGLWLSGLGARVFGYALSPPTEPNFFNAVGLEKRLFRSTIADVRDSAALRRAICDANPDVVFHLAAQPLVRVSYRNPAETYEVNVMGLVRLLEAVREISGVRALVVVTSDKCYEIRDHAHAYREADALGGYDPYSSSKACAELVASSWRRSFLAEAGIHTATARAGNVIGGGDWAEDRLVPDFLRALDSGRPLRVRSPDAVRPWQHVLEPLHGYLLLAEKLALCGESYAEAWNFGPDKSAARSVRWVVETLQEMAPNVQWDCDSAPQPHEAQALHLDSSKARTRLEWRPRWDLRKALTATLAWYTAWKRGEDMAAFSLKQIREYLSAEGDV